MMRILPKTKAVPTIVIPIYAVLSYGVYKLCWPHITGKAGTTTQVKTAGQSWRATRRIGRHCVNHQNQFGCLTKTGSYRVRAAPRLDTEMPFPYPRVAHISQHGRFWKKTAVAPDL